MSDLSAKSLRDAASTAHRCGDREAAVGLFEKILDLFPETPEAIDALFYLSSIGRGRRRAARGAAERARREPPAKRSLRRREA
jgi:uncharacterized membrane-anchored protein